MPRYPGQSGLPFHAGPVRSALHAALALSGWVLFVYWWWLVSRHVSRAEIRLTLLLIAIALAVIVAITVMWVFHNVRVFRSRGARKTPRGVPQDFSHDTVGRNVQLPAVPEDCLSARVVHVRIQGGAKVYTLAAASSGPAGPAAGTVR